MKQKAMRLSILILIGWFWSTVLSAQPQPCIVNEMTSTCSDACVVCDIDGFTGRNNLSIQGQTFPEFCTTIFHNMSYIAFIAGTEDLTLTVSVTNCTIGRGVEIGIFESSDCQNFTPVTDCNTDVAPNGTATFSNLVPLVVGQHYYLILDGSMGDICDWTFNVVEGSTVVGDLTSSGIIQGAEELCPELSSTYSTTGEQGATMFFWTVDGVAQNGITDEINITFPTDGTYQLCVTAANVCDEAPPSCTTINVVSPKPTFLTEVLCASECFDVAGETVCESGTYEYVIALQNGCDSLVFLDLTILPEASSSIDINLCIGDEITIGNTSYATTGVYTELIQTDKGCDSIVNLDLTMIDCEIIGSSAFTSPICHGDQNGTLVFSLENGTPPFNYNWSNITTPSIQGTGTTNLFTNIVIENIPAGFYEIYVTDDFGNDIVFIQEVTQPLPLTLAVEISDYNGYQVTCFGADDGSVSITGTGGVTPYTYLWTTNDMSDMITNLSAGTYGVSVTDDLGCIVTDEALLTQPDQLGFRASYIKPNCDGLETGVVQLDSVWGGSPPYLFALDDGTYGSSSTYKHLSAGAYAFSALDANGCLADTTSVLDQVDIPELYMDEDQQVDLGCTAVISATTNNTSLIDISWTDLENSLDCTDCLTTDASPVNDTRYVLSVTSEDDCTTIDSISVRVNKIRDVHSPNIFSPNEDGQNDYFTLYPGKSVSIIKKMNVYDRWGSLVYEEVDILPDSNQLGWDGYTSGRKVTSGVYVWMAEVEYLDGVTLVLKGDVTVFL